MQQARELYDKLHVSLPITHSIFDNVDQPSYVLQILRNQHDRSLIMSWPPILVLDGSYSQSFAEDLASLAQLVRLNYASSEDGQEARTSCTRRYKNTHNTFIRTDAGLKFAAVESVFVPHGKIISVTFFEFRTHLHKDLSFLPVIECSPCPQQMAKQSSRTYRHSTLQRHA